MCGIIGFATREHKPEHAALFHRLMVESQVRGLHAFGASWHDGHRLQIRKWETLPAMSDVPAAQAIIYHNRYSTSGDWHADENNQPLQADGVSVAVNGVLSMKPRSEYEAEYGVRCATNNDAEILLRRLLADDDPEELAHKLHGSLAAVFIKCGEVYAIRNTSRPLHWLKFAGAVFVVSTVDIADRAGAPSVVHNVPAFKLFRLLDYV